MLNSLLFFCRNNRSIASDTLTKKGAGGVFTPLAPFLIIYVSSYYKPLFLNDNLLGLTVRLDDIYTIA